MEEMSVERSKFVHVSVMRDGICNYNVIAETMRNAE